MTENNPSRDKILQAAIEEFSENGIDGARVARIAQRAGVSQSLLYYNYTSKQAILDEIIQEFLDHNVNHLVELYPGWVSKTESKDEFALALEKSLRFIQQNHKEVNILLMQALLKSQGEKKLLTILNELNETIRKKTLNEYGFSLDEDQGVNRKVVDFFYIFVPFIVFGVLGKEWAQENNVALEEVTQTLSKVAEAIYNDYLK
ncbi:MAG TPA: TetR/AcrR family transcriptional regulator [Anaerolineaceae bacterium]|nr:TetR/AcrR family transcriptional regulator [Anaerolineaceae bacterium]